MICFDYVKYITNFLQGQALANILQHFCTDFNPNIKKIWTKLYQMGYLCLQLDIQRKNGMCVNRKYQSKRGLFTEEVPEEIGSTLPLPQIPELQETMAPLLFEAP